MSLNPRHLRAHVVAPTLRLLAGLADQSGLESDAAHELMLGTAWQESGGQHLVQLGGGPALGLWQVEPATAGWIDSKLRAVRYRGAQEWLWTVAGTEPKDRREAMVANLTVACAYARLRYWFVPAALPAASDVGGLGRYWKKYYNTHLGAGTAEQWVKAYGRFRAAERRATA